ncbi:MAG: hypothetical protein ACTJGU_06420, partial [Corynebacterium casei]
LLAVALEEVVESQAPEAVPLVVRLVHLVLLKAAAVAVPAPEAQPQAQQDRPAVRLVHLVLLKAAAVAVPAPEAQPQAQQDPIPMAVVRQIRISQRPGVIRLLLSPWALVHHRTQVLAREWEKQGAQLFVTPVLHHAEQAKSLLVAHE